MGRVSTLLGVATSIKLAVATVAVASLAFVAMANPAWAQDTTLSVDASAAPDPVTVGQELTYTFVVTNTGTNVAEDATLLVALGLGTVEIDITATSVSTSVGRCQLYYQSIVPPGQLTTECWLGDLAPGKTATVTLRTLPTSSGQIEGGMEAWADNFQPPDPQTFTTTVVNGPPGGPPPPDGTPESKQECKKGGYEEFGFRNQGQCIKAVNRPDKPTGAQGPKNNPPPGFDWNNNIP